MRVLTGFTVFWLMALPPVWFALALSWGFTVNRDIALFQRADAVLHVVAAPMLRGVPEAEVTALYGTLDITPNRRISVRTELPFADMLAPVEAMPAPPLRTLYATLRASRFLMPLCRETLGQLAAACAVGPFAAEVNTGADYAVLTGDLHYLPGYDTGDPWSVANSVIRRATVALPAAGFADGPEGRRAVYTEARRLCDAIRARFGNCVIAHINLSMMAMAERVAIEFAVIADRDRTAAGAVQGALDSLVRRMSPTPRFSSSVR